MKRYLDIELLRTFKAICEVGSFQGASRIIGRSQAAVTMQVKKLEEIVGKPLLLRERPVVRPTPAGEVLLKYAHRLMFLQDEVISALTDDVATGVLRFGIPDDYTGGILPTILAKFATDHPLLEMSIVCGTTDMLENLIGEDGLDVALVSRKRGESQGRLLKEEPIVWAASKSHALHLRDVVPLGVFQEQCMIRKNAVSALSNAGINYRICFSSPNLAALTAVVSAGVAIASIPKSSVPPHLGILGLSEKMPELPSVELAIIQGTASASPATENFLDSVFSIDWGTRSPSY